MRSTLYWLCTIYGSLYQIDKLQMGHSHKQVPQEACKSIRINSINNQQCNTNSTTFLDAPKSASLMHPLLSTRMFAPYIQQHIDQYEIETEHGRVF